MILDELITDRTAADVTEGNAKGTYNTADLNRVGEAVDYVASVLNDLPGEIAEYLTERLVGMDEIYRLSYDQIDVATKTDWTDADIPTTAQMATYLDNVVKIKESFALPPVLPEAMNELTYQAANSIEQILLMANYQASAFLAKAKQNADKTVLSFVYSGEAESGEI